MKSENTFINKKKIFLIKFCKTKIPMMKYVYPLRKAVNKISTKSENTFDRSSINKAKIHLIKNVQKHI